jgi:hypothetical protein
MGVSSVDSAFDFISEATLTYASLKIRLTKDISIVLGSFPYISFANVTRGDSSTPEGE